MTDPMAQRLRDKSTDFVLEDVCMGDVRGAACGRVIRVIASATYS